MSPTQTPTQVPARTWKIIGAAFVVSGVVLFLAFGFIKNPILLALGAVEIVAAVVVFAIARTKAG